MKTVDYKLVTGFRDDVAKTVNRLLEEGWEMVGHAQYSGHARR